MTNKKKAAAPPPAVEKREATTLAREKLASSAIPGDPSKYGMEVLTAAETKALGPNFLALPALKLNYLLPGGKPTGFYRLRYLKLPVGIAGMVKKPQRYAQPAATLNGVYMAHGCKMDWANIMNSADQPLIITEGELKAHAACLAGIPTLGLGGVDVWQAKSRGYDLLPALRAFEWKNREIIFAYDSDLAENEDVQRALVRVCEKFSFELGAKPSVAFLEPLPDGRKAGLDDVIATRGVKYLRDQLNEAQPYVTAQALLEMNDRFIYIRTPGLVIDTKDADSQVPVEAFRSHVHANAYYYKTNNQGNLVRAPLARDWIEWPFRRELRKLSFAPGQDRVTPDRSYNLWRGWPVKPAYGDISRWKWLLDFVLDGCEPEHKRWFERWCAIPLQRPGTKCYSAAVVTGRVHGTGKSLIGYSLMQVYGNEYAVEVGPKTFLEDDNAWAQQKLFVLGNEVTGSDKRQDADRVKNLITQTRMRINIKYVPKYEIDDLVNYYFTSNHADAFYLEDTDRRFFVHDVRHEKPATQSKYVDYVKWIKSAEGKAALFQHLLDLDLGSFDPTAPAPITHAKETMIFVSRGDLAAFVRDDLALGHAQHPRVFRSEDVARWFEAKCSTKISHQICARELARAGCHRLNDGLPARFNDRLVRLWSFDPVYLRPDAKTRASALAEFKRVLEAKY